MLSKAKDRRLEDTDKIAIKRFVELEIEPQDDDYVLDVYRKMFREVRPAELTEIFVKAVKASGKMRAEAFLTRLVTGIVKSNKESTKLDLLFDVFTNFKYGPE